MGDDNSPSDCGERRRHTRKVCSVLSEVFAITGDSRRYIGPGVVLDMSEFGLALVMDFAPAADVSLLITNAYFEVRAKLRSCTTNTDGMRLGLEFTSAITWHRPSDALPTNQLSSVAQTSQPALRGGSGKREHDPLAIYRTFLDVLGRARRNLPDAVRKAIYPRKEIADVPNTLSRCDLCKKALAEFNAVPGIPVYIPLRICTSCLADAAPFETPAGVLKKTDLSREKRY
jgi:hypothetical protein